MLLAWNIRGVRFPGGCGLGWVWRTGRDRHGEPEVWKSMVASLPVEALLPVTSRQSQGEGQAGFLPLSPGFILGLPASDKASRKPMLCPNSSPGMRESGGLRETSRFSELQSLEMPGHCLILQVRTRGST